jgi:hypothetical protein
VSDFFAAPIINIVIHHCPFVSDNKQGPRPVSKHTVRGRFRIEVIGDQAFELRHRVKGEGEMLENGDTINL